MNKEILEELRLVVAEIADQWSGVTSKKMFGCPAFWVNQNVFALVWKHGRIGVKLTDSKSYDSLMAIAGSAPWKAGPMTMSNWVLVPETYHADRATLKKWLKKAFAQNEKSMPKPKKKATEKVSRKAKK